MNKIWDKVYSNDSLFFGNEPSKFALMCYEGFVKHKVKKYWTWDVVRVEILYF
jgi:hypothetical protein